MLDGYYKDARKLALKEYRACVSRGQSPCLPVMDDFIPTERSATGQNLGLVQVPCRFIVGTKTRGRVNAFGPNFMPILDEGTEFADKWETLCQAHLTEGIRDPIKVYEYMNRYYVEEGNKRVSVLKFFDAYSIPAQVIRVMPLPSDDEDVQRYLAFVEFYKVTKANFIELSDKKGYQELLDLMDDSDGAAWDDDKRSRFASVYYSFEKAFLSMSRKDQKITPGDAMLSYMEIYGYEQLSGATTDEIKTNLKKMWEEVALKEQNSAIDVKADPAEVKKPNVLSKLLPIGKPSVLKAAFIYDGTPEKSGWVNDHEQGRQYAQKALEGKAITEAYPDAMSSDLNEVIRQAIENGNKVIFTTSPRMLQASLLAAVEYPDVKILNCSLNISHRYVVTYYPRMYEVKFILGVLAGSLSDSGRIGYVCDYPIYGQIAGVNAFALGAQMANPRAKIFLEWSSVKGAKEAALSLQRQNIHVISSQDTARFLEDDRSSFGLSHVGEDKTDLLAVPVWKWGVYYEEILSRMLDKTMLNEYEESKGALNYFWGMSAGVVDIEYAPALPLASRRFGDFFRESFIRHNATPFLTPFYNQNGEVVGEGQKFLSTEEIINIDYLVDNIVGSIPVYEQLSEIGKDTVDVVGVEPSQKDGSRT